jgi:hypothetical protein
MIAQRLPRATAQAAVPDVPTPVEPRPDTHHQPHHTTAIYALPAGHHRRADNRVRHIAAHDMPRVRAAYGQLRANGHAPLTARVAMTPLMIRVQITQTQRPAQ